MVHLPRRPALVQRLHVAVAQNEAGPLTFRLNLYRLDAQGRPTAEKLLAHDVFVTAAPTVGVLAVDLAADRLLLNEDFLLALEWVKAPPAPPWPTLPSASASGACSSTGAGSSTCAAPARPPGRSPPSRATCRCWACAPPWRSTPQ
ncbi:hypothetical protein ACFQT0_10945 [Hymenobacter humi]|uniref:Uncharacterized protein n=1 Tax=Hymenobacter humi TaxID=1411620 RepID=A0ABW2U3A5_9BACT